MAKPSKGALTAIAEVDRLLSKYPNPRDVRRAPTLERTSIPLRDASPELYGFLGGAAGTAPDDFEGSVLDPLSARVKAGANYGYPLGLAAEALPGAALLAKFGAKVAPVATRNAMAPAQLGKQAGVIKAPGGNWLSGSVEDALKGLKSTRVPGTLDEFAQRAGMTRPELEALSAPQRKEIGERLHPEMTALNQFIDKQLTRYVKNDMATGRDPIRALAERGVLHVDPEQLQVGHLPKNFMMGGSREALGTAPSAKRWEDASDSLIDAPWEAGALVQRGGEVINKANPWAANIPPETLIHRVNAQDRFAGDLGFNHLMDELRNATNPNSGLPAHLLLDPKSLDRVSVPQAVERVAAINDWRAAQKAEASQALANNAATVLHKEYPDKGFKWVELKTPARDDAALEKAAREAGIEPGSPEFEGFAPSRYKQDSRRELESALKYEGDTMGSCVGGRCDAVASGASRIYSLRDAKGQPHVTLEVKPNLYDEVDVQDLMEAASEEMPAKTYGRFSDWQGSFAEGFDNPSHFFSEVAKTPFKKYFESEIARANDAAPKINEIKGKGNKKPNDEYLPFVQDFVKSGKWSDVGDLQNTGLVKYEGSYRSPSEFQYHNEDTGAWEGLLDFAKARFPDRPGDQHNFVTGAIQGKFVRPTPPGYATGGTVTPAPAASSPQSWQALYRKNNATEQPVSDQNKITQTKDQFLAKYADALDANGRFVPGKANLWFDGESASDVYDKLIGKQTVQTHYGNLGEGIFKEESFFNPEVNMDWIEDPRAGGGWAGMKGAVLPGLAATAAIMGGQALLGASGAGSAAGGSSLVGAGDLALAPMPQVTAASLGSNASGLAGALGMKAGVGAAALNSGALNAGMTALRGGNIGQVLKSGVQGAVLSPIASYGSGLVGGGTMGSVFGNSLQGGAANILGGRDAFSGFRDGAVNGFVRTAGNWVGAEAKDFTGSDFAGKAANSLTQTALKGKDISSTLDQLATQYASGQLTDLSGMDPKMAAIVVNLARNKKSAAIGIATGALTQAAQRAVGSKKLSDLAVGS